MKDFLTIALVFSLIGCVPDDDDFSPSSTGGDLIFIRNQKQLNQLGQENRISINGSLVIFGVNDLSPLSSVERVNGNLFIGSAEAGNPSLKSLNGLENLNVVNNTLLITQNDSLTSLSGLEELILVGNNIDINDNGMLNDFCGIRHTDLDGEYMVKNNDYNPTLEQLRSDSCKID